MSAPLSTYRLQFTPTFRFSEARELLGYFEDLGISHLYASPIFKARRGSMHGYDVIDVMDGADISWMILKLSHPVVEPQRGGETEHPRVELDRPFPNVCRELFEFRRLDG